MTPRGLGRRATRSSPARAGGISTCGVHTKCCREGEAGEVGNAAVPGNQESDRVSQRAELRDESPSAGHDDPGKRGVAGREGLSSRQGAELD